MEAELLRLGEYYIENMPSYDVLYADESIGYESRYVKDVQNGHVTCTTYKVRDFDIQMFKDMREGGLEHQNKMAERMRCWKLEEEEGGRDVVVMRTLLPFPLSNRFMISTLYHDEKPDGYYVTIQSSRANQYYYKKYRKEKGRDEIANHVISMTTMRPNPEINGVDMA